MSARGFAAAGALLLISSGSASAAVEIQWWHAMQGERGRQLERLAADFNASAVGISDRPGSQGHVRGDA